MQDLQDTVLLNLIAVYSSEYILHRTITSFCRDGSVTL